MDNVSRIYLICGFMGSGKSFFLNKIKSWGLNTIDLDDQIFKKYGAGFSSLGEYIRNVGWECFRKVESNLLLELALRERKSSIFIALGGGALDCDKTRAFFKEKRNIELIWLNCGFDECINRIKSDENRPQLDKSYEELVELYASRVPYFNNAGLSLNSDEINSMNEWSDLERKLD